MERNLTIWRKLKNKVIQKWWIYNEGKSTLKHISFNEPSSGLKDSETSVDITVMDVLINYNGKTKENIYKERLYILCIYFLFPWWRFIKTEMFYRWLSFIINSPLLNYSIFQFFSIVSDSFPLFTYIYITNYKISIPLRIF